jgi:hypothetical protein
MPGWRDSEISDFCWACAADTGRSVAAIRAMAAQPRWNCVIIVVRFLWPPLTGDLANALMH